jgi:hypothetical protein
MKDDIGKIRFDGPPLESFDRPAKSARVSGRRWAVMSQARRTDPARDERTNERCAYEAATSEDERVTERTVSQRGDSRRMLHLARSS